MNNSLLRIDELNSDQHLIECGLCGSQNIRTEWQKHSAELAHPKDGTIHIEYDIPLRICQGCEFEFTDDEAESIEDNAIRRGYGLLIPEQIVALRKRRDLSQQELSDLTGIGVASIGRWETRAKMQSLAYDNLLRMIIDDMAFENLLKISQERHSHANTTTSVRPRPKFRCIQGGKSSSAIEQKSTSFKLY